MADDNDAVLAGDLLPDTVSPYVTVMIVGFVIGAAGHLVRSRWLVATGIAVIVVSLLLFQLAAGMSSDEIPPPTPTP